MGLRPRRTDAARVAAVLLLASLLAPGGATAAAAPAVDYLYADANEGGASGGHVAIRFGDEVFHYEYRAPGMIRLRRDDFEGMRHRYTILDNRTLVLHRIPVSEDTFRRLHDEFARRHIAQEQDLRTHDALIADRRLLETLQARLAGHSMPDPPVLEGVGFFFDEARAPELDVVTRADGPPALVALRDRVGTAHGTGFVDEAMRRLARELSALVPGRGVAERYQDLLVALLALEVLRDARPLREGSLAAAPGPALEGADLELVGRLGEALAGSLVRLVRSDRPDRGYALLIGMARLVALDETRRTGRWTFLDAFAPDAPSIPASQLRGRSRLTQALLDEARDDFAAARLRIDARSASRPGFPERDFVELEAAGNRLGEIAAADGSRAMRLESGLRLPSREAVLAVPPLPPMALDELDGELTRAREREEAYEAELRRLYGYDLIGRNCVTEIFRTIDAALAPTPPDAEGARRESTTRLGGHVDVEGTLNFIPTVSAHAVRDTYAIAETIEIPSYRLAGLARLARREGLLRVRARESNTVTSTLYQRNPADSAFLFFTDDTVATRPLLGAVNLVVGLGVSAAGVFTMVVDGGDLLRSGLKGVLFSLPEMAFFNIRKGSLIYAPRH
jgi:hypothetical protein